MFGVVGNHFKNRIHDSLFKMRMEHTLNESLQDHIIKAARGLEESHSFVSSQLLLKLSDRNERLLMFYVSVSWRVKVVAGIVLMFCLVNAHVHIVRESQTNQLSVFQFKCCLFFYRQFALQTTCLGGLC